MRTRTTIVLASAVALFSLAACDGEVPSLDQAKEKAAAMVKEMGEEKIAELGRLAAKIEKDPSQAEQILKDAGFDRKAFDKAIEKIQSDPNLKKAFEKAKEMAKQSM